MTCYTQFEGNSIYYYIHPELGIGRLPFSFGRRSRDALEGALRENPAA